MMMMIYRLKICSKVVAILDGVVFLERWATIIGLVEVTQMFVRGEPPYILTCSEG